MKILLVNPPTLYRGKSAEQMAQMDLSRPSLPYYERMLGTDITKRNGQSTLPGEHLGLQSCQAALEMAGHEVVVLNACVALHATLYQTLSAIKAYSFDLIGFSGPLDVFPENQWLAAALRESGYVGHITLGHDFATLNHEAILTKYLEFDSIVRGEGEITLVDLANILERRGSLKDVLGLSYRDGAEIFVNHSRPVVANLDALQWVTRYDLPTVLGLGMSASLFTGRGCPYRCSFCTTGKVPIAEHFGRSNVWRHRSAKSVVDEIEVLARDFGISSLTIVDDLFIAKGQRGSQHALEIAQELITRELGIEYMIDCRVDSIESSAFTTLKRSGLKKVFVGVESASETTLDTFQKGYRREIIRENLRILENLGIEFILGFIMFSPLETLDGLGQSYRLISELGHRDYELFLQSVRVYPGTDLQQMLEGLELIEGVFPHFVGRYVDPNVKQILEVMSQFAETASTTISLAYKDGEAKAVQAREQIYLQAHELMGQLIEVAKRNDMNA